MNPQQADVDALASAIDRVVFHEAGASAADAPALALISYLNDSFPRMSVTAGRRPRLERRLARALRIPTEAPVGNLGRIEAEMNRRLGSVDPRWRPFVGGAALVLLGVVGVAVWRQRGTAKPAIASMR